MNIDIDFNTKLGNLGYKIVYVFILSAIINMSLSFHPSELLFKTTNEGVRNFADISIGMAVASASVYLVVRMLRRHNVAGQGH